MYNADFLSISESRKGEREMEMKFKIQKKFIYDINYKFEGIREFYAKHEAPTCTRANESLKKESKRDN